MGSQPRALAVSSVVAMAILILIPSSATSSYPLGSFYPILAAAASLGIGLAFAHGRLRRPPFAIAIIIFYMLTTAATIAFSSPNPYSLLLPLIAVPAYWSIWSASSAERTTITHAIVLLATGEALLGFGEVLFRTGVLVGDPFLLTPDNPFLAGAPRAQGTLAHPLVLGFLMVAALGLVCAEQSRPVLRVALMGLFVAGTVLTGSSSAVIVALVIAFLWFLNRRTVMGLTFSVLATLTGALLVVGSGLSTAVIEAEFDERNAGHRVNSLLGIPNLLLGRDSAQALFGSGYGTEALYTAGIFLNDGFYTIDNQYVSFLAQGGILGCALVAGALIAMTVRIAARPNRRYLPGWIGLLAMGLAFDFMAWYVSAVLLLAYGAMALAERHSPETSAVRSGFALSAPQRIPTAGARDLRT